MYGKHDREQSEACPDSTQMTYFRAVVTNIGWAALRYRWCTPTMTQALGDRRILPLK